MIKTGRKWTSGNTKTMLGSMAKGALAGSAAGGIGAIVGGVAGGIYGAFEEDPEEELRKRKEEMLTRINAERTKRIAEITRTSANQQLASTQGAAARALDSGRDPSDIEDSMIVNNQRNVQATNETLRQTNQAFDEQVLGVEGEYLSRPLQEPLSNTLFDIGNTLLQVDQLKQQGERQDKYIDAMTKLATAQQTSGLPGQVKTVAPVQVSATAPSMPQRQSIPVSENNLGDVPQFPSPPKSTIFFDSNPPVKKGMAQSRGYAYRFRQSQFR